MDGAAQHGRSDALERRAIWVLALGVFTLVYPTFGLTLVGGPDWWNVVLFVGAQTSFLLAVAGAALVPCAQVAIVPERIRNLPPAELLGWAVGFLWLGLFLTSLSLSIVAIDAIGSNEL